MATLNYAVSASSDDARNAAGGTQINTGIFTQYIGKNSGYNYWNGFRWTGVAIPSGSTINSATIDLYSAGLKGGTTAKSIWYGVLEPNTVTFNTTTVYPEMKTRTTASVTKDFTTSLWASTGFGIELVTVTSLLQEIIDQGGWSSGNALAIVCSDNGSSSANYIGHNSYDREPGVRGAKLTIDYTPPAGASGQIKVYNGSTFVAKPVKVWNGSTWVTKPVKRWNGSSWVTTPY